MITSSPGLSTKPPPDVCNAIVRPAAPDEAADLFRLISDNLETGHLLPRPLDEVVLHIPMFLVAVDPASVVGCAELARLGSKLAEVRSLVVADTHRGQGVGKLLLNEIIAMARQHGYAKLSAFAYNPRPFVRLGFSIVPHPWIPEKISTDCHQCVWFRHCEQYAMILDLKQKVARV
jgi:N-acetylglutamate synthase-like GNAT family acetyltransferase